SSPAFGLLSLFWYAKVVSRSVVRSGCCALAALVMLLRVDHSKVSSGVLGNEPPLLGDDNRSGFQTTNSRWLIAHIIFGLVAGCLLTGALSVAVGPNAMSVAPAKRTNRDHQVVVEKGRGDPDRQADRSSIERSTFEQLNDVGAIQSYTRMTSPLA